MNRFKRETNVRMVASSLSVRPYMATLGKSLKASLMQHSKYFSWRISVIVMGRSEVPKIRFSSSLTRSCTSGWLPIKYKHQLTAAAVVSCPCVGQH